MKIPPLVVLTAAVLAAACGDAPMTPPFANEGPSGLVGSNALNASAVGMSAAVDSVASRAALANQPWTGLGSFKAAISGMTPGFDPSGPTPALTSCGGLQVTGGAASTALAQLLAGPGVHVVGVNYSGNAWASGAFSCGGPAIGIEDGVVLSSGKAVDAVPPNNMDGRTSYNGSGGDPQLQALIPSYTVLDATSLTLQFIPNASQVAFEYVFTSEEYNEYANTSFNDVFGFFVNGQNCALLPGGSPVSINNVNGGNPFGASNKKNPQLYRNNDLTDGGGSIGTQADGLTVVMVCQANVNANQVNTIKLAIGDAGDTALDSWVFIKGGSLSTTLPGAISVSPQSAQRDAGEPHTVTATVRHTDNTPFPDILVDFRVVSGPSAGFLLAGQTNQLGQFSFIWGSAAGGIDRFEACFHDPLDGGQRKCAEGQVEWMVLNQPPTAFINTDMAVSHGQVIQTDVHFQDPDVGDAWTYVLNWGDGSAPMTGSLAPGIHLTPSHTFPNTTGTWTVTFTVTDKFGAASTATQQITYTNAEPLAVISLVPLAPDPQCTKLEGGNVCINGGPSYDPDPLDDVSTLDFHFEYGDPAHSTWTQTGVTGQPPFVYGDNGTYPVKLTVTDMLGLSGQATKDVFIANVAPSVNPIGAGMIESGDAFNVVAHFTDPGALDAPWSWTVDWGDDDPITTGSTTDQNAPITTSKAYLVPGKYTVNVCVTDKDNGTGCTETSVTVKRMNLLIDIKPGSWPNSINVGTNGSGKGKSGQSEGSVPVALLGSSKVDASKVDVASLRFGDKNPPSSDTPVALKTNGTFMASLEDVNADGFLDLVLHFDRAALLGTGDLSIATVELWLTGVTADGRWFVGSDAVRPIG